MSHRLPTSRSHGPTPALSQYSGPPSVQPNQAGPASTIGASYHTFTVQPQKPSLKGLKAARHQDRKTESPSTSAPWKDPLEAAVASAGHKRSLKDGVLSRQSQSMGPPPPPSEHPTRRKEGITARRQAAIQDFDPAEQNRAWFRESMSQLDRVEENMKNTQRGIQELSAAVDATSRKLLQLKPKRGL